MKYGDNHEKIGFDDAPRITNASDVPGLSPPRTSSVSSLWDLPATIPSQPQIDLTKSPILRMYPGTFVPLRHRAMSIAEVTFLVPSSNSSRRKATILSAIFNMTATIIGGGVLSIPLSCARAGVIPFTALMIGSAVMTDFSLYILCSCARRTGSTSFGRVAGAAVGPSFELLATAVIFFLVGFILVGLMVLNQGIWAPIFVVLLDTAAARMGQYGPSTSGATSTGTDTTTATTTTTTQDAIVLFVLLTTMFRFLLAKDLTSLRHICYVGFCSIAVLCVTMTYRAAEKNFKNHYEIKWAADNLADILNALPIILLAFLCSFNIISVHCSLIDPAQNRVKGVIHWSVLLSFLLMYVFGLAGYFWAFDETHGNILLNFDPTDSVVFVGRIGCGITTLFALPMNLLPCREALLSLIAQLGEWHFRRRTSREEQKALLARRAEDDNEESNDPESQETTKKNRRGLKAIVSDSHTISMSERLGGKQNCTAASFQNSVIPNASQLKRKQARTTKEMGFSAIFKDDEVLIHWVSTIGIVVVCYIFAVLAPGVAIVWDIAGSSMAFLIQFIIPSVCYIRLKEAARPGVMSRHLKLAWILLVVSSLGAILCTSVVISRLM